MSDKEKVRRYEADVMALPPLRMVLGDVPSPDPQRDHKRQPVQKTGPEMEVTVLKLISRLKDEK
jgi:hypothetical protein